LAAPDGPPKARGNGVRPPPEPSAADLVMDGPVSLVDIPALCDRVRVILEHGRADVVLCDTGALVRPDAVSVDALSRLELTARQLGGRVRFLHACGELRELLAFVGLGDVLPLGPELRLERGGKPEEREQMRRVEEEADPGDAAV
jgi:hypothetical protein